MGGNHYLFTNLLTEEETNIITSIIKHIENGERRIPIQQLANENFVSTTFIIKMSKRLGFEGYSELYYQLSRRVSMGESSDDQSELHSLIDNYSTEKGKQFCDLITQFQGGKIFTDGKGFSDLVANYMAQRLAVFGFMAYNQLHFYDFMIFHIVCFKLPTDPEEFSVELYIGFPDRGTRMQPRLFANLILQSGRLFLTRWRCGDFRAAGQPSTPSTICWECLKDKGGPYSQILDNLRQSDFLRRTHYK